MKSDLIVASSDNICTGLSHSGKSAQVTFVDLVRS